MIWRSPSMDAKTPRMAGFTTAELLIVVALGLTVTTLATPNMLTVIANTRLRGNITTLSGIFQNSRMLAVKNNRTMTTHLSTAPQGIMAFVKLATDTSGAVATDPQVELEAPIIEYATPNDVSVSALDNTALGFTPLSGDASFNSRGLPCAYSAGTCSNNGFA